MVEKVLYRDKVGNKFCKKYIKTRKVWQYYAKNREGRIVNPQGFRNIAKRAGYSVGKIKKGICRTKTIKKIKRGK